MHSGLWKCLAVRMAVAVLISACGGGRDEGRTGDLSDLQARELTTTTIYDEGPASGWVDWSWGSSISLASTTRAYSGTRSISWKTTSNSGGLYLHSDVGLNTTGHDVVSFAIYAVSSVNVGIQLYDGSNVGLTKINLSPAVPAGAWRVYRVDLSSLGASGKLIKGFSLIDHSGSTNHQFYVDAIKFDSNGSFGITTPLALSPTSVAPGGTVTGTVTYTNNTSSAVTVQQIVIAGRPPGGTHVGGPYYDFSPSLGSTTLNAGASVTLKATRTLAAGDPTGTWYAYAAYQDSAGVWHDGPPVNFSVTAGCAEDLSRFLPPAGGMTPPGSALPTDAQAECMVKAQSREHRPGNAAYKVAPGDLAQFRPDFVRASGGDSRVGPLADRVTGAKTSGTTDEIIQWAAYKWGIDPDVLRAIGINETYWHHGRFINNYPVKFHGFGDFIATSSSCTPDFPLSRGYVEPDGRGPFFDSCPLSFGFTQWKYTAWPKSHPHAYLSMPFNMDAWGARIRVWYEGYSYCGSAATGDMWQAVGAHFSGECNAGGGGGSASYVQNAKNHMASKPWNSSTF